MEGSKLGRFELSADEQTVLDRVKSSRESLVKSFIDQSWGVDYNNLLIDFIEKHNISREELKQTYLYHVLVGSGDVGDLSTSGFLKTMTRFDFENERSLARFIDDLYAEEFKVNE